MVVSVLRFGLLLLFATSLLGADRGAELQPRATRVAADDQASQPVLCSDNVTSAIAISPLSGLAQHVDDAASKKQPPAHACARGLVPRLEPADSFQLAGLTRAPPRGRIA